MGKNKENKERVGCLFPSRKRHPTLLSLFLPASRFFSRRRLRCPFCTLAVHRCLLCPLLPLELFVEFVESGLLGWVGDRLGRAVTIRDGRVGAEGRGGQDFAVVAGDGTVQLPPDTLDVLPPGSLARALRTARGVELRPITPEQE